MALYFFHLRDGEDVVLDPDGQEIADASLLAAAALKEARAIVAQDALKGYVQLANGSMCATKQASSSISCTSPTRSRSAHEDDR